MKKILCIFFIIILLIQSVGLLFFFQVQRCITRFEMHQKIKNSVSEFEKLTMSMVDYKRNMLNKNEVSFGGKMYDVKSISFEGDKVHLLGLEDSPEASIILKIKALISCNNKPDTQAPSNLIKLISLVFLFSSTGQNGVKQNCLISIYRAVNLKTVFLSSEILTPPPQLV